MKKLSMFIFLLLVLVGCQQSTELPTDFTEKEIGFDHFDVSSRVFTVGMIGDILLHDEVYPQEDFVPSFAGVKSSLEEIDFLMANQESMPGGVELGLSGYPSFNSPAHILAGLQDVGVDVLSIANNHTLDRGERGVRAALKNIQDYEFPYVGAYESEKDLQKKRIFEVNDVQIGVLAYTYGTNGIPTPKGKDYLVNRIDPKRITREVKDMRKETDLVIVSMHWGNEYEQTQNQEQESLAQVIADAGGDIVFGHHPHVLQPFDVIQGKDGNETSVYYSIGNFFTGQTIEYTDIGGIAKLTVAKDLNGEVRVGSPSFVPTTVIQDDDGFRVVPLQPIEDEKIVTHDWVLEHVGVADGS